MPLRIDSCPQGGPTREYMDRMLRTIELWARRVERGGTDILVPSISDGVDIGSSAFAWGALHLASGVDSNAGSVATINKSTGRFRVAAGSNTFVLTNSRIAASDTVLCQPAHDDIRGRVNSVVPGDGVVTINLTAPALDMDCTFVVIKV